MAGYGVKKKLFSLKLRHPKLLKRTAIYSNLAARDMHIELQETEGFAVQCTLF
jgi:hypothetical protein